MKNGMGGTCSTYEGGMHTGVLWGNLMERDPLDDQSLDGRIVLRWVFKKWVMGHRLD